MPEVDLQNMEEADIASLATRCLDCLSLSDKVQAVLKSFHAKEERDELSTWLADDTEEE